MPCMLKRLLFCFSPLEMELKQSCCLQVSFGRCLTNNVGTLAKAALLDFSSKHTAQVAGHPLRCLGCISMAAGTEEGQRVIWDQEAKARPQQRKENARGRI